MYCVVQVMRLSEFHTSCLLCAIAAIAAKNRCLSCATVPILDVLCVAWGCERAFHYRCTLANATIKRGLC